MYTRRNAKLVVMLKGTRESQIKIMISQNSFRRKICNKKNKDERLISQYDGHDICRILLSDKLAMLKMCVELVFMVFVVLKKQHRKRLTSN